MIQCSIDSIKIKGISCALPDNMVLSSSRSQEFGKDTVNRIIENVGVQSVFISVKEQTASDLSYLAAKRLIDEFNIEPESIGALIFVTQTPDYRIPSTAFVLQYRLGLSENCICYDINLGCSGYINGLYSISTLINSTDVKRALLLVGETPSKRISPLDRSLSIIFGDCGTATLLEKDDKAKPMIFSFKTFGEKYNRIIIPAGGYRNPVASEERIEYEEGNFRSKYDTYMNGQDVFSFTVFEVPDYLKAFISSLNKTIDDYDYFFLHQANIFILKQIAKKMKVDPGKILKSLDRYGNTSSTSIPLTISTLKETSPKGVFKALFSGFGVGLSWAAADVELDMDCVLNVIHSNEFYTNGSVFHG